MFNLITKSRRNATSVVLASLILVAWAAFPSAAFGFKDLTILGTQATSVLNGRDIGIPGPPTQFDILADDDEAFAARFDRNTFGKGLVSVTLIDNTGQTVASVTAKASVIATVILSTEAGASGP
jgi:hypothetical protein